MKQIIVTVKPNGEASIETLGYTGVECQDATRKLEAALGQKLNERLTSEWFATNSETEKVNLSQ